MPDGALLERSLTQWQFGDWDSLARISLDTLQHHPDRAKLALLAAAAHFHYNNGGAVRQLLTSARAWGCSNRLIGQILLAGVHNTLGRVSAARGDEARAVKHFETSITTVTPDADARLLAKARLALQVEQLDLRGATAGQQLLPGPRADAHATAITAGPRATPSNLAVRRGPIHHLGDAWLEHFPAAPPCGHQTLFTAGHCQYGVFATGNQTLRVLRRRLASDQIEICELPDPRPTGHGRGALALAIDRAGHLLLAYGASGAPVVYRRSIATESITDWSEPLELTAETLAAGPFPSFILPHPAQPGRPLMAWYAEGPPERRTARIKAYDETAERWIGAPAAILSNIAPDRGPCGLEWSHVAVDRDGALHLAFVFDLGDAGRRPTASGLLVGYAMSTDGGRTWQTSTRQRCRLPIQAEQADIVQTLPPGRRPLGPPGVTVDNRNRPHISVCTETRDGVREHHHIWVDGHVWRRRLAPPFDDSPPRAPDAAPRAPMARPEVLIDRYDTVFVIDNEPLEQGLLTAVALPGPAYQVALATLHLIDVAAPPLYALAIDHARWTMDGTLSMLIGCTPPSGVQPAVDNGPSQVLVADMRLPPIVPEPHPPVTAATSGAAMYSDG